MSSERIKNVIVQFWISPEMDNTVRRISTAEGRSLSSIYRELVEKGLVAGGYIAGTEDLSTIVQSAVADAIKPQADRLAAISAKGTQIAAAAFFLAVFNGKQALPPHLQDEYDDVATRARKLGIEYLKLSRDASVDAFISRAISRIEED